MNKFFFGQYVQHTILLIHTKQKKKKPTGLRINGNLIGDFGEEPIRFQLESCIKLYTASNLGNQSILARLRRTGRVLLCAADYAYCIDNYYGEENLPAKPYTKSKIVRVERFKTQARRYYFNKRAQNKRKANKKSDLSLSTMTVIRKSSKQRVSYTGSSGYCLYGVVCSMPSNPCHI